MVRIAILDTHNWNASQVRRSRADLPRSRWVSANEPSHPWLAGTRPMRSPPWIGAHEHVLESAHERESAKSLFSL
eukprot:COSAG02_NODE_32726_length_511_cov_1.487864_1_plen_74_part_10